MGEVPVTSKKKKEKKKRKRKGNKKKRKGKRNERCIPNKRIEIVAEIPTKGILRISPNADSSDSRRINASAVPRREISEQIADVSSFLNKNRCAIL